MKSLASIMNKLIVCAVSAVGVTALSLALPATSAAAADNYTGQTYGAASSQLSAQGQTPVIAGRVGGILPDDDCIVTRSQGAVRYSPYPGTVKLYLNCSAGPATSTTTP